MAPLAEGPPPASGDASGASGVWSWAKAKQRLAWVGCGQMVSALMIHGAAAEVRSFGGLGKKVRLGTFGKINVG